jgi:hypothetical protein
MNYKTFAIIDNKGGVTVIHNFEFDPDSRYITLQGGEPTPIEDFGNYMLSPKILTEVQAYNQWVKNAL